jgi:hypothetical protein
MYALKITNTYRLPQANFHKVSIMVLGGTDLVSIDLLEVDVALTGEAVIRQQPIGTTSRGVQFFAGRSFPGAREHATHCRSEEQGDAGERTCHL